VARVILGQFMHETNTFSVQKADVEDFHKLFCYLGNEIPERLADTNSEMAGFLDVAAGAGWGVVHTVAAFANPCGHVTERAWTTLGGRILDAARSNPDIDGVLLGLHGAMVTERHDDAEGQLLEELRAILGPDVPIAVTLDLHANVSDRMARHANILCSYRTYPHVDMRERGREAGALLARAMAGEIRPRTVVARRAMLIGAEGGRTDRGVMLELLERARAFEQEPGVLAVSVNAGFSKADIVDAGPSVTVTGEGEDPRYTAMAETLMDRIWATRKSPMADFLAPEAAVARAKAAARPGGKPVVIADFADNPGAGAYGDATNLLKAMLDAGLDNAAFGSIRDPEAVAELARAGAGAEATVAVGGKVDPSFGGPPLTLTGTVVALTDGDFVHGGPMWTGLRASLGPSAVFRVGGVEILVASNLLQLLDRQMFLANGIDPESKSIVAVKSMQHFRGAFAPIASEILVCDTGALASPDLGRLPYRTLRRPIYPFDLA